MSLIKIFPAFSSETERNIQATVVSQWNGLNIWLQDTKEELTWYVEIPFVNGSLFERAHSYFKSQYSSYSSFDMAIEVGEVINKINRSYASAEDMRTKHKEFYTKLWSNMCAGELDRSRHYLVSYTKFCIIFGPIVTEGEFNSVLISLKEKQLAKNAAEKAEIDEKNRIVELKRREERLAVINKVKGLILKGESINGGDLVDFCKDYGIKIHIRTQGTIRQKVSEVDGGSYRVHRGTIFKVSPTYYYAELKKKIEEERDNPSFDSFWREFDGGTATKNPV